MLKLQSPLHVSLTFEHCAVQLGRDTSPSLAEWLSVRPLPWSLAEP